LGQFSEIAGTGVALGYVVAEWEIHARWCRLRADSGTGALDQMVVAEYFSEEFQPALGHLNGVLQ